MNELTPEQIEKNWETFCSFFDKLGERSVPAKKLLDAIGETFALAPASGRLEYHNAFCGGLVEHSIRVLKNALKLKKAFNYDISDESLIIGCLFHDLGKTCHVNDDGTLIDYYVKNESEWHREKLGKIYNHNDKIPYFATPDRAIWLCMKFGLVLSYEEYCAIRCADGQFTPENEPYKGREPLLATIVHAADYIATRFEKSQYELSKIT